jgi:DNA-binding NarL/FixJ family response regulator
VDDDDDALETWATWCQEEGFEVATALDGFLAIASLRRHRAEVAVVDLAMPGMDGLTLIQMLKAFDPNLGIIILSGQTTFDNAVAGMRSGMADEFLAKPLRDLGDLSAAIRAAAERHRKAAHPPIPRGGGNQMPPQLTLREGEIALRLAEGLHPEEIASQLQMSTGNLKNHLSNIYAKLGVKGRAEAIIAILNPHEHP